MRQGMIAQTAAFYLDQWPNMVKTEAEVPGSEVCAAASPGAHTWVGAFGLGLSVDSEHPDEAWEFLKFLSGPDAQRKFAQGGGTTTRMSILQDPEILALREQAGHFPVLVDVLEHAKDAQLLPQLLLRAAGRQDLRRGDRLVQLSSRRRVLPRRGHAEPG